MRFECPGCQAKLKSNFGPFVVAVILCAPIMAFPIIWAVRNPVMWLLVPVSILVQFFVYYGVFSVSLEREEAGNGGA